MMPAAGRVLHLGTLRGERANPETGAGRPEAAPANARFFASLRMTRGSHKGSPVRRRWGRLIPRFAMPTKVAIVGVGHTTFRATSPGLSYKELMFEAATRAYADAGLDPRGEIDSFLTCSEDLAAGTSIFEDR